MTAFCLIHGAWHEPSCWEPLTERLVARGYVTVAPDLPLHDPRAGFDERVRPALQALATVTDPVIVVGHSLGSTYAPLVAVERPGSLVVHLCARLGPFAPPPGAPAMFRRGVPFPADRDDGTSMWDAHVAIETLYRRLPRATARAMAKRLRPLAPINDEYPLAGHPDIPTALIFAAQDEIFEPAWERFMATELLGVEPIEVPGGHFPMLEDPDLLAGLLQRLADEHTHETTASSVEEERASDATRLLTQAYAAFSARDIDAALELMHPDVDWPNAWEGGRVVGHAAVRSYWERQFAAIASTVEPLRFTAGRDGAVTVEVRQVVHDVRTRALLANSRVRHRYRFDRGLIARMDVLDEDVATD